MKIIKNQPSRNNIVYLLGITNSKESDKEKASLIINYILDNKIDIASYGDKYLFFKYLWI